MRILFLTPGLGVGGSERLTLTYARGLAARGHETMIAHGPPEALGATIDRAGVARRLVHRERLGVRTLAGWLPALRAVVREFRPDVESEPIGAAHRNFGRIVCSVTLSVQ